MANIWRNFLLLCILQRLLSCSVPCLNADEDGHKTSNQTKSGQHNFLLNRMLWKSCLRSQAGFSATLRTRETGFHSHWASEAKMTFGFTMPKEVESIRAEVGDNPSHRPESLRPRLAGETELGEARTACRMPSSDEMSSEGNTVFMRVPSETDTRWWRNRNPIRERRLRFDDREGGAPFRIPAVIFERLRGPAFPKMRAVNSIVEFLWRSERVRSTRPNDRPNIN